MLFCDLVGFTAASEAARSGGRPGAIGPTTRGCGEEIERFGGTVEKFVGDAVMAVFGAPLGARGRCGARGAGGAADPRGDRELNEADPVLALQVRVGINTGEAVVALGARPEHGEGTSPATS